MATERFKIVFEKLVPPSCDGPHPAETVVLPQAEYDEIAELRRLAIELAAPEQQTNTIT